MVPSQVNPLYEALVFMTWGPLNVVDEFCSQLDSSPHQRNLFSITHQLIPLSYVILEKQYRCMLNQYMNWPWILQKRWLKVWGWLVIYSRDGLASSGLTNITSSRNL